MLSSVKGRIIIGFGVVMALLIAATIANVTMVSGIRTDFNQFQSALTRKSSAVILTPSMSARPMLSATA